MRNQKSNFITLGASNHSEGIREINDYYATDPEAVKKLLEFEKSDDNILEPCCGEGHISKVLIDSGYLVQSQDLIDRGYGVGNIDFLKSNMTWNGDIITNPPYKHVLDFVKKSLNIIQNGKRVAMLLKIQFLETQSRYVFFKKYPPKIIYVFSKRIRCVKNGDFKRYSNGSAMCYCWFIWEKDFKGEPVIRWII